MFIQATRHTANALQTLWAKASSPEAQQVYLKVAIAAVRWACYAVALALALLVCLLRLVAFVIATIWALTEVPTPPATPTVPPAPAVALDPWEAPEQFPAEVEPVATTEHLERCYLLEAAPTRLLLAPAAEAVPVEADWEAIPAPEFAPVLAAVAVLEPAPEVPVTPATPEVAELPDLAAMSIRQLKALAKARKIKRYGSLTKAQLVEVLS